MSAEQSKEVELIQWQLDSAKSELDNYRRALTIRKRTLKRTQQTIRSCKAFIKFCQRSGVSSSDANELYKLSVQAHMDHDQRRMTLKDLVSDRADKVYLLTSIVEKLRG